MLAFGSIYPALNIMMIKHKLSLIILCYLFIGVAGNIIGYAGSWEKTNDTILKGKGLYKDFYPITGIKYAGFNKRKELVLCVTGRQLPEELEGFRPQQPEDRKFRPVEYAVLIPYQTLTEPEKNLYLVTYGHNPANLKYDYSHKDTRTFAYTFNNILDTCPLKNNLPNLSIRKGNTYNKHGSRTLALYWGDTDKYISAIRDHYPSHNKDSIYKVPHPWRKIHINGEAVEIFSTYGDTTFLLYSPAKENVKPIILAGGYIAYEKMENNHLNIALSAISDVLYHPVKMIYYSVITLLPWDRVWNKVATLLS